jgi:hypothetical protein
MIMITRSHTVSVGARHPQSAQRQARHARSPHTAGKPRTPTQRLDTTYRQLDEMKKSPTDADPSILNSNRPDVIVQPGPDIA